MGISIQQANSMTYFNNTNQILQMSSGYNSSVASLQSDLTTLGYNAYGVDGYFGNNTKNAVISFQRNYGLDVDGVAGSQTLGKINELINQAKVSTVVVPKPIVTDSVSITGNLQIGSKGNAVKDLQEKLIRMGYDCGGYGADGDFGWGTYSSVVKFQRDYGLTQDGIVGSQTSQAIANTLKTGSNGVPNYIMNKPTNTSNVTTSSTTNLQVGSKGSAVADLQKKLIQMGYNCGGYGADGNYGQGTYNSVVQFQKYHGLTQDGIVGSQTRQAIENALKVGKNGAPIYITNPSSTASITPSSSTNVTLQLGSKGSSVADLQKKLIQIGYNCGGYGADGNYGQGTYNSVVQFQRDYGLTVDGIVGVNTKNAIQNQLGNTLNITGKYSIDAKLLQNGSIGTEVTILQERLKELNLYNGIINGRYDSLTEFSVKQFQMKYNVTGDTIGVAGSNTINKLNEFNKPIDITDKLHALMNKYEKEYGNLKYYPEAVKLSTFYNLVKTNGPLDLKNQAEWKHSRFIFENQVIDNDVPGNILYGYVGKAMGFSDIVLCSGAGIYQIKSGTSKSEWENVEDWGDDPRDQAAIKRGIQEYNESH